MESTTSRVQRGQLRNRVFFLSIVTLSQLTSCTCFKKPDSAATGNDDLPRALSPLPPPPKLDIQTEAVPGGDGALAVVSVRPSGKVFYGEIRPTITFSKPIMSLQMVEAQRETDKAAPVATISPAIEGEWRWLGSSSIEFVPKTPPKLSTEYTITVKPGIKAIDGSVLEEGRSEVFTTRTLSINALTPERGSRWLTPDGKIIVEFNQPVDNALLEKSLSVQVGGDAQSFKLKVQNRVSVEEERQKEKAEADKKAGRTPVEPSPAEIRNRNPSTRYTLAFNKPLPLASDITIAFADDLHGSEGPVAMEEVKPIVYRTYGPMQVASGRFCYGDSDANCPYGPLELTLSNEVLPEAMKGKIKVTPAVDIDFQNARTYVPSGGDDASAAATLILPGKWRPGTSYKITIEPGVKDVFGQLSAAAFDTAASTDSLRPEIIGGPNFGVVESKGADPRLPLELSNVKTLDVKMWNVASAELPGLVRGLERDAKAALPVRAPDFNESEKLRYARNVARVHPIEMKKLFGEKKTGIALLQVVSPDVKDSAKFPVVQLVQFTDMAAHFKMSPTASLAWVTSMSSGTPVIGANVSVLSQTGEVLFTGTTGPDGFCEIPGTAALKQLDNKETGDVPFLVLTAEKDGDLSYTSSRSVSGIEPYEFGIAQGWEGEAIEPHGFAFTDRGIYRPGDEVYAKAVLRYRVLGELKSPPPGTAVNLTVSSSNGEKIKTVALKVSKYGTVDAKVPMPKGAALGYYNVNFEGKLGGQNFGASTGFRVEEYRAPQFSVDVETQAKDLISGDTLSGTVVAKYLFGGAISNAKTAWNVRRDSSTFSVEQFSQFEFSQQTWWRDDGEPENSGGFFSSGDGLTDAKGRLAVSAGKIDAPGARPYDYTFEAEVTDVNRLTAAGRAVVKVHPAQYYVGLKPTSFFSAVGKPSPIETIVVSTAGKPVASKKVDIVISERSWKSIRKKDATGGFSTISEPTETETQKCELKSAEVPVPCNFEPKKSGFYIVRASVTDEAGRKHSASLGTYATGSEFVAWQRNDSDRIELVNDKPSYAVGDVAKILVKSPYPTATAMVTVEREGVLSKRLVTLKGSVSTVEIPITEQMIPNVFAGVLLVRPRVAQGGVETGDDPGRPAARLGLTTLKVENKAKRVAVTVSTDKNEYQPRDTVNISIDAKDFKGAPISGEVTLMAVDVAVLRVTSYETPDPLDSIFRARPLSVRTAEPLLDLVRRRNYGEKGEEAGGGGGRESDASGIRNDFRTTPLFLPALELKQGKAEASFKLPDNLTSFRLMAVVVTQTDKFGSGEKAIQVNKPLMALPAFPRFARIGDTFEAGAVIHAKREGKGDVVVTATVSGPAQIDGEAKKTVRIEEGSPKEVRFALRATGPGVAEIKIQASNGSLGDGVLHTMPIESAVEVESVAAYGDTTDSRTEGLQPPPDANTAVGGLTVSMASTSLGSLQQGFSQLIDYPYGCLEQQASRLIPFVALREVGGQFGMTWPKKEELKTHGAPPASWLTAFMPQGLDTSKLQNPDEVIATTVRSLNALQDPGGGFRYWSDSYCTSSWPSAYATLALARAKEVGFSVPDATLSKATGFVSKVAGGDCGPCERACGDETRVFASYVLARIGKPKASNYSELYARRKGLSLFSQALLANAMFIGNGERDKANALLKEILNSAQESPSGLTFADATGSNQLRYFQSSTRTTAAVLQALTDISPQHPYVAKMVKALTSARQKNGEWRNTQEAAFSMMALTQVLRTKEKDTPDFNASVTLGSTTLAKQAFKGRSMELQTTQVPMSKLGAGALAFKKEGAGVLYYTARLSYAQKTPPTTALDNGLFVQRWFEPFTGGGQAVKFYSGDLVRIRLRVASNQSRQWAAFEVPLPAGLEPVDTSLSTTAQFSGGASNSTAQASEEGEGDFEGEDGPPAERSFGFWSPFSHTEVRDSKFVVFADELPAGVHLVSFVARATTPGNFSLKPARGALMYEPEIWGRSEGGVFEVTEPPKVSQK